MALVGGSKESHDQHWIGTRPPVDRETVQSGARRLITFMRQMRGDRDKAWAWGSTKVFVFWSPEVHISRCIICVSWNAPHSRSRDHPPPPLSNGGNFFGPYFFLPDGRHDIGNENIRSSFFQQWDHHHNIYKLIFRCNSDSDNPQCRWFCLANQFLFREEGVPKVPLKKMRKKQVFLVQNPIFHVFQPFLVHFIAFSVHF